MVTLTQSTHRRQPLRQAAKQQGVRSHRHLLDAGERLDRPNNVDEARPNRRLATGQAEFGHTGLANRPTTASAPRR